MTQLGEELRRERMRRGLTYKDVEQRLHIRSAYLEALEEGNYDVIPGQVYTKGFIRNYGNFLCLNGKRLIVIYKQEHESEQTLMPLQAALEDGSLEGGRPGALARVEDTQSQGQLGSSRNLLLTCVIAIILLVFLGWLIL